MIVNKTYTLTVLRFLKSKHCLKRFIINTEKRNGITINNIDDLDKYFYELSFPLNIIDKSFCWAETNEHHNYWSRLNGELYQILYNKK